MSETDTSEPDEAQRQADEAAAEVEVLEGRLSDGDENISAEQVAEAHAQSRWARLRAQGARRRAERQHRRQRADEAERLTADGEEALRGSQQRVNEALAEAREAFDRLVEATDTHNRLVDSYAGRLAKLRDVLPDGTTTGTGTVQVGGWSARRVTTLGALGAVVGLVIDRSEVSGPTPNGAVVQSMYLQERAKGFQP